ncbi:chaperone NapD [Sulfurospirillum sp. 1612]|uniref:chaperone NapD n=1 Tax=Sulfurospirillum sp. 1612 TaxID=3094835 RepID=UPI002F95F3AB
MNISSIVVQVLPKYMDGVLEILKNAQFCDYHYHDSETGKIIVTIEGESVDDEIRNLKIIQGIEHVIAADMMMSYSEDELDREIKKLEAQNAVPEMLNDDTIEAKDIVYHGDLKKKNI